MNQDKCGFAQPTAFLKRTQFNNFVHKYVDNRYMKQFVCRNQLLTMTFGQQNNRESILDLIVAFETHRAKQYHLGLGRNLLESFRLIVYYDEEGDHEFTFQTNTTHFSVLNITNLYKKR